MANCQSLALADNLAKIPDFKAEFQYTKLPAVHTIDKSRDRHLLSILDDVDLLIYQPVLDENRFGDFCSHKILSRLSKHTQAVGIPSMYYTGYFPTLGVMHGVMSALNGVHDYLVVASYLAGNSIQQTIKLITDRNSFPMPESEIRSQHELSLRGLNTRESENKLDIRLSDYIRDNHKKVRLFHQFNHPTVELIQYVCSEICTSVGIDGTPEESVDTLNEIIAPIYGAVRDAMDLSFEIRNPSNNGQEIGLEQMVEINYDVYDKTDRGILQASLERNRKFLAKYF